MPDLGQAGDDTTRLHMAWLHGSTTLSVKQSWKPQAQCPPHMSGGWPASDGTTQRAGCPQAAASPVVGDSAVLQSEQHGAALPGSPTRAMLHSVQHGAALPGSHHARAEGSECWRLLGVLADGVMRLGRCLGRCVVKWLCVATHGGGEYINSAHHRYVVKT